MSNLFDPNGAHPTEEPPAIHLARATQVRAALQHVLASPGQLAPEQQVLDFLRLALQRQINLEELWVAERHGSILWAALPIVNPGRTMLLLSPAYNPDPPQRHAAALLLEQLLPQYTRRDVHLAQVLLDPASPGNCSLYESCGFRQMAELLYLHTPLRRPVAPPTPPPTFTWETYTPQNADRFAQAIAASYQDSLDCPALNGLRDLADIIVGHQATGEFDPARWFLLCESGVARAVVLLSAVAQSKTMELVYLGLAPQARGRGLGDLAMRQALAVASQASATHLTLAVDAANIPAMKLYFRHGLQRLCTRLAWMRDLRPALHQSSTSPINR